MTMMSDVHQAIDGLTATTLFDTPVLYGRMPEQGLSRGTAPYVRQQVVFAKNAQAELTNRCFRRHTGYVLFYLHWRGATGDAARNLLQDRIEKAFASRLVGGATLQDVRTVSVAETENWSIVGLQIPFYFDEVQN